ncbi:hypothetical protein [Altericroceibacterium xinjiangense]|uniref:hypothetical protein n=1 Tax=Altericroceibacterium xinjiangense TaxID=762261 RepID=UPI000F7EAF90|nr:hypothetical protein [Altericroceibacterium xinjiangense]
MNTLATLILPLALLAPQIAGSLPVFGGLETGAEAGRAAPQPKPPAPLGLQSFGPSSFLQDAHRTPAQNQVRIERRVTIRISPARPTTQEQMMAQAAQAQAQAQAPVQIVERELDGCIPVQAIAGVQPGQQNRLLLFMHDTRVLSAALERACTPRDFYQGFYIDRTADGMLCPRRDRLQSRAGASCEVTRLSRLTVSRD